MLAKVKTTLKYVKCDIRKAIETFFTYALDLMNMLLLM